LQLAPYLWFYSGKIQQREGAKTTWGERGGASQIVYPCKDGYALWRMYTGGLGWQTNNLVKWMKEERMADGLDTVDWAQIDMSVLTKEQMVEWESVFAKFFLTKTKKELFSMAMKRGIMVLPLYNAPDISQDPQLKARNFWVHAYHPEIQSNLTYPGIPFKSSDVAFDFFPSPQIGEHTHEILKEMQSLPKPNEHFSEDVKGNKKHDSALSQVKVLDLGWVFAGPFVARFLGDYVATVIKVESSNRVDPLRTMSPYAGGKSGVNRGAYFLWHNPNKYSVCIDMRFENGLQLVKRLIAWADVVVENFSPGTLEKLGLGYEELKKINPGIILVRVSSVGQNGPYAHIRALGQMLKGLTGLANTGVPDQIPTPNPVAHTDFTSGYYFTCATLAALDYRRKTGKGQCIDGSQVESGIVFYAPFLLDYEVNGRAETLKGNRIDQAAPHNAYRCKGDERWCVISVFSDREWMKLCNAIGKPLWAKDPKYSTLASRKENEDELDRLLESWTVQNTPEQVMEKMQAIGIAAGVVKNAKDLFEDPQLEHRGHFRYVEHSEIGTSCYSAPSYRLMDTPPQINMPTPCLGEHTEFVCREILKIDDEEFINLFQEGILE
jgi:benzylsuccinate CoA-transferase BbsF subunit